MKKVLVTGADTGFGNEAAMRLAEKGSHCGDVGGEGV